MLIFDLDGTLIDSAEDIGDALNLTLQEMNVEIFSRERIMATVGSGIHPLLEERFANDPQQLEKSKKLFDKNYTCCLANKTRLFPGAKEVLIHFKERPKTILTNKRQKYADAIIEKLDLKKYFVGVYGRDAFSECKPSPLPIQKILEIHQTPPSETWMIGDSYADIQAARSANVRSCGVLYGYTPREQLLKLQADIYVETTDELITILETR